MLQGYPVCGSASPHPAPTKCLHDEGKALSLSNKGRALHWEETEDNVFGSIEIFILPNCVKVWPHAPVIGMKDRKILRLKEVSWGDISKKAG
jgi:hypothetical protein